MPHQTRSAILCCVALTGFVAAAAQADPGRAHCKRDPLRYEVIDLGTLGAEGGYAAGVTNHGQVTGAASVSDSTGRAFVWDCASGMTSIGALSEDHFASSGSLINERGVVVGQSFGEDTIEMFIWDRSNGMRAVASGMPFSLNNRSEVTYTGEGGIYLWTVANGATLVSDVTGLDLREAFVNNLGQIGGYGVPTDDVVPGYYVWKQSRGARLLALEPESMVRTFVYGFNDRGDLFGNNYVGTTTHPFLVLRNGEIRNVTPPVDGQFTEALAFNNLRQVVGYRFTAEDPTQRFYIWDSVRGMRDLNELAYGHAPGPGEPRITWVYAINDWGWIAASALRANGTFGNPALVVPVPAREPYYRNLGRLRGAPLCRALTSLKVRAAVSAITCR